MLVSTVGSWTTYRSATSPGSAGKATTESKLLVRVSLRLARTTKFPVLIIRIWYHSLRFLCSTVILLFDVVVTSGMASSGISTRSSIRLVAGIYSRDLV